MDIYIAKICKIKDNIYILNIITLFYENWNREKKLLIVRIDDIEIYFFFLVFVSKNINYNI